MYLPTRVYHVSEFLVSRFKLTGLLLLALFVSPSSSAASISFTGIQTYEQSPHPDGWWYHDASSLAYFDFSMAAPGFVTLSATDARLAADPYARIYYDNDHYQSNYWGYISPDPIYLAETGLYTLVVGYGSFDFDDAMFGVSSSTAGCLRALYCPEFTFTVTVTGDQVIVPEPGVLLLLISGLMGFTLSRKRILTPGGSRKAFGTSV